MWVCISSPRGFFCSSEWWVDTEDYTEETSGHRSSPITVCGGTQTKFLVQSSSFTISYVESNVAGKRVGERCMQLFSWHWPGDDESILLIVISMINTNILVNVHAAIANLPHTSRKIQVFWGCWEYNWWYGEEWDDLAVTWRSDQRKFQTTITGFTKFQTNLHRRILRQLQYLEFIRNGALGLFTDYN